MRIPPGPPLRGRPTPPDVRVCLLRCHSHHMLPPPSLIAHQPYACRALAVCAPQARTAALAMVGVSGDLRLTMGLQAVGGLSHLAGQAGGAAALLQVQGLLDTAVSERVVCQALSMCPVSL